MKDFEKKKFPISFKTLYKILLTTWPVAVAVADAAEPWQLSFQDPATPIMQGLIDLHHDIFFFHGFYPSICMLDVVPYCLSFFI